MSPSSQTHDYHSLSLSLSLSHTHTQSDTHFFMTQRSFQSSVSHSVLHDAMEKIEETEMCIVCVRRHSVDLTRISMLFSRSDYCKSVSHAN
ncbi:hypothetical protein HanPI659440_Chr03g0123471 [Helianthus annuus]|nr:hypothetical protein HanPI659440_Chr03g0123471 [Helianthus annuus]